jgi:hypothetical protein
MHPVSPVTLLVLCSSSSSCEDCHNTPSASHSSFCSVRVADSGQQRGLPTEGTQQPHVPPTSVSLMENFQDPVRDRPNKEGLHPVMESMGLPENRIYGQDE